MNRVSRFYANVAFPEACLRGRHQLDDTASMTYVMGYQIRLARRRAQSLQAKEPVLYDANVLAK